MRIKLTIFLLFFAFFQSPAQLDTLVRQDSVPVDANFRFKDGIFLNFKQVKTNSPVPRQQILTNIPEWDINFYDKLVEQKTITFYYNGRKYTVSTKDIWGYSDNGVLYIRWKDDFAKIANKGALCYFIATQKTRNYYSPYGYWYYDPYMLNSQNDREVRNFILDFNTGKIYQFNVKTLLSLFKKYDPKLYQEYSKLRPRKQRKLMFFYIRKFNQRNKTYIYTTISDN